MGELQTALDAADHAAVNAGDGELATIVRNLRTSLPLFADEATVICSVGVDDLDRQVPYGVTGAHDDPLGTTPEDQSTDTGVRSDLLFAAAQQLPSQSGVIVRQGGQAQPPQPPQGDVRAWRDERILVLRQLLALNERKAANLRQMAILTLSARSEFANYRQYLRDRRYQDAEDAYLRAKANLRAAEVLRLRNFDIDAEEEKLTKRRRELDELIGG